jgi:hypothetical protein
MFSIDTTGWQICPSITGDGPDDTALLRGMYLDAQAYIATVRGLSKISNTYLAYGIGGILALFLVEFTEPVNETDICIWVVVGDIPSAYFVMDDAPDPKSALRVYCEIMSQWAEQVLSNGSLDEVFPVEAKPTSENALLLQRRLQHIRETIIPQM